jgi:hypothetical protein
VMAERSSGRPAHHARTAIEQIRVVLIDHRDRGTGSFRIGAWRPRPEDHDRSGRERGGADQSE